MSLISETLPPELIRRKPDLVTQNTRPDLKKKSSFIIICALSLTSISLHNQIEFAVGKLKKWHEISPEAIDYYMSQMWNPGRD